MRIGLFGNCQAGAIAQVLAEHLIDDEVISFKAIHTMNDKDKMDFLDNIKTLDILIHQPVSDVYAPVSTSRIIDIIGEDNSLIFPVMYFSPYFMDITYLKDTKGNTDRNFISDYHSRTILSAFHYGLNKNDIYNAFNSPSFFPKELIIKNCYDSLEILKNREKACDINISDFINKNYQSKNLFYTFNHPTGNLLFYTINSLLKKLERNILPIDLKVKHSKLLGGGTLEEYGECA